MKYTKNKSILIVAIIYAAALIITYLLMSFFETSLWAKSLIADILCTFFIFAFSRVFNNSSIYDPYWSVIPFFLALFWLQDSHLSSSTILLLVGFLLWGARLTFNWVSGWEGLHKQDWRYVELQTRTKKYYWFVSLAGIHLFPTLIVFLGCMPAYYLITDQVEATYWHYLSFGIMLSAIIIEMVADVQMHRHRKSNAEGSIRSGLWTYSRHPNYFGEILFWIGVFLISLPSAPFWTISGPISMIFLFYFVSIPMMEKRLATRKGFTEYKKNVSRLVPWIKMPD